jgi:hypothetical protein
MELPAAPREKNFGGIDLEGKGGTEEFGNQLLIILIIPYQGSGAPITISYPFFLIFDFIFSPEMYYTIA